MSYESCVSSIAVIDGLRMKCIEVRIDPMKFTLMQHHT